MASPDASPDAERRPINPVLIVAGTLVAVVVASFLILSFGDDQVEDASATGGAANRAGPASAGACGEHTPADASYRVDVAATPEPPRPDGTNFVFTVRQEGRPVTGAKVCLTADMPDMEHPGLNYQTREAAGGRYEARVQFGMGGRWSTSVIIAEPGRPVVSVPLTIQVTEVATG